MTVITAEIGVNFRNLNEADEMIWEAAAAGADAVKFQAYEKFPQTHPLGPQLNAIALDETAIRYLYWRCRAVGVEFLCTPMYKEAVPMLDPYVKRWKIRYMDRENEDILAPCRATGKPMLISGKNVFCVPEYPPQNAPINKIPERFSSVSSHYPDIHVVESLAWKMKPEYIELHVKRDHYPDNYCPIDNSVSITMSELAELCRRLGK